METPRLVGVPSPPSSGVSGERTPSLGRSLRLGLSGLWGPVGWGHWQGVREPRKSFQRRARRGDSQVLSCGRSGKTQHSPQRRSWWVSFGAKGDGIQARDSQATSPVYGFLIYVAELIAPRPSRPSPPSCRKWKSRLAQSGRPGSVCSLLPAPRGLPPPAPPCCRRCQPDSQTS